MLKLNRLRQRLASYKKTTSYQCSSRGNEKKDTSGALSLLFPHPGNTHLMNLSLKSLMTTIHTAITVFNAAGKLFKSLGEQCHHKTTSKIKHAIKTMRGRSEHYFLPTLNSMNKIVAYF